MARKVRLSPKYLVKARAKVMTCPSLPHTPPKRINQKGVKQGTAHPRRARTWPNQTSLSPRAQRAPIPAGPHGAANLRRWHRRGGCPWGPAASAGRGDVSSGGSVWVNHRDPQANPAGPRSAAPPARDAAHVACSGAVYSRTEYMPGNDVGDRRAGCFGCFGCFTWPGAGSGCRQVLRR